jgi:hypothetical protein
MAGNGFQTLSGLCRPGSQDECLKECTADETCNCAIWVPETGGCQMYWPYCDAAIMKLQTGANATKVALQPCRKATAKITNIAAVSSTCALPVLPVM